MKFELLLNPTHSPNLAPSDYYMFGPRKGAFRGRRFESADKFGRGAYEVSITTGNFLPRWEGRFVEK